MFVVKLSCKHLIKYKITTKIVQQDRDECLEIPNLCKERNQCLNTPGKLATPDLFKGDIRDCLTIETWGGLYYLLLEKV